MKKTNKETIDAIRALSNLEGFLRAMHSRDGISEQIGEQVDIVFNYLKKDLRLKQDGDENN